MAVNTGASMNRSNADTKLAREKEEEVVSGIISDAEQTSVALQVGNVRRMNAYQTRMKLQNGVPDAYWINGTAATDKPAVGPGSGFADGTQQAKDFSLKQTTSYEFDNVTLTPDELAVMVIMPDNWRDDSDMAWDEVRTSLRTAFAKAIDRAIFWGTTSVGTLPASFGDGVIPETLASGIVIYAGDVDGTVNPDGTRNDIADVYARAAQALNEKGYDTNAFVVGPGEKWNLVRQRTSEGALLNAEGLFGLTVEEARNGTWNASVARALAGDFSQLHIGIRQDMTFALSNDATIRDQAGVVQYSAFQQDGEVLRAVMRLGYVVTDPFKHLTSAREYPFAVIAPGSAPS